MAAAPDTATADSITGLGETLQNLVNINVAGFAGIKSTLRSEFSGQNKLLGGFLGKNLQLIADALTDSSSDMIKQMQAEARLAAEQHRETLAAAGADKASTVEAKDMSMDLSITGILAALAVFLIGFVKGYIAELKLIGSGLKNAIMAIGKDAKALWNVGKGWLGKTKFGIWFTSMKSWFNTKVAVGMQKVATLWKNSGIFKWYNAFKAFFVPTIDKAMSMKHHTKIMNESGIMKVYKSITKWFGKKIPFKVPNFKAMWTGTKGGVGSFFTKIKTFFGKSAFLEELGKGIAKVKSMFTAGGPGIFSALGAWIKSFKIPFPKWLTDIITKVKTMFSGGTGGGPLGKLGAFFGKLFIWFQVITAVFDFWGGWVDTKGTWWDKLWGGLSAALKGFINAFLDLGIMIEDGIKWIIKKIGGFFGFDEAEIESAIGGFSIFKPIKAAFNTIIDWVVKLMTDPLAAFSDLWAGIKSVGSWIYDMGIKPVWDWIKGMFGFGDDKKPADDGKTVLGTLGDLLKGAWDWFLGLFGVGPGHSAEMPADDGQTVMGKLGDLLLGVWKWFKGLFGFGEGGGATTPISVDSVTMTLANLLVGAWSWFKGLFGFSSPEEDADTAKGVGGFLKDLVDGVWGYFKKLFQFGSIGDVMKSYFNLLTFFPNIIKDAIAGVTSWLLGLFGFDEAAKTVANAQNFSLGDMVFNAIKNIWDWFKGLLDIDVAAIAKGIPGAETLLSWMGDSAAEKNVEGMTKAGLMKSDEGTFDADQIVDITKLQGMMKGMSLEGIKNMMMEMKEINESDMIGKGDEIANWEVVQKTLQEGAKLAALQKEANELSGSGSTTTIIQDNSQNTSNSSQEVVIPTEPIAVQSSTRLE